MSTKTTAKVYYIICLVLMALGVGFLFFRDRFSLFLFEASGALIVFQTGLSIFREKGNWSVGRCLLYLGLGVIFMTSPLLPTRLLAGAIGLYQGGIGIFLLLHSSLAFANRLAGRYVSLIDGVIHIGFAITVYHLGQAYLPNLYGLLGSIYSF